MNADSAHSHVLKPRERLAILADFREENWPSMDLVAEMFAMHANQVADVEATLLRPAFRRLSGSIVGRRGFNLDRFINRMAIYPRFAASLRGKFDFYHVADHSYSQCVTPLASERVGVFCHDVDTFRCLVEPQRDPRPKWFRQMARRILKGFQSARVVFHSTGVVRDEIVRLGLTDPSRLVHAPFGIAPEFSSYGAPATFAFPLPARFFLNVGSGIPRKRLDVLLKAFASVAHDVSDVSLIQVGGEWNEADLRWLETIPQSRVLQVRGLSRLQLADLYRRAELVVQPSAAEGFGLPVLEALACGAAVVASDIAVFREVAGDAIDYFPVGDASMLAQALMDLLQNRRQPPSKQDRLARAARYSWSEHARAIVLAYRAL